MDNKEYSILSPTGVILFKGVYDTSCTRKFSLMSEDSVTLKFSTREAIAFPVGSSVGDFLITREQPGTWNANTGVWDYQLKFDAYYWAWANRLLRYVIPGVDSANETSFTLTATIDVHANVIKNCLDFLGIKHGGSPFRVEVPNEAPFNEARLVRYENLSVLGGVQAIAEAYECEWWVDGNAVCFGRLENKDTDFTFEAGKNVSSTSFSEGKAAAPNRLYVYGSTRNLPANYRQPEGDDTIGAVVERRLMLPEGTPCLQTDPDLPEAQVVEATVVLDDVYPRTELTVSEEPEAYTSEAENADGSKTEQTFYRIRYGEGFPFLSSYILPNEELHIVFTSGLLNGMDFGARFNPKGLNEKDTDGSLNPEAQMLEVVANGDYGRMLPDDILKPQKGDTFTLYGWDSTKMADLGLTAEAEARLLAEGKKALEEYAKDTSTCTCPMAWDYMKPLFERNSQPKPGDSVTVIDTVHFGNGGRRSRIIGYEHTLDRAYANCTYTCGESVSVSRLKSIENKIEGLAKSGTKVQMQNSLDYLSKRYSDRTAYDLGVGGRLTVGEFVSGFSGLGADARGNMEAESGVFRSYLKVFELIYNRLNALEGDTSFADSGTIESLTENADGTHTAVMRKRWEGDFTAFQPGDVIYGYVNDLRGENGGTNLDHYKCWARVNSVDRAANTLSITHYGDSQVPAGRNFPLRGGMLVSRWGNGINPEAVGGLLDLYASKGAEGTLTEEESATYEGLKADYCPFIVNRGGKWVNTRQQSFYISCEQGNLVQLTGVDAPILREGNYGTVLGLLPEGLIDPETARYLNEGQPYLYARGVVVQDLIRINYKGVTVRTPNFRGEWSAETAGDAEAYYRVADDMADVVSCDGSLWQCAVGHASGERPSDGNPEWARLTPKPVDDWRIIPSVNVVYIRRGVPSTDTLECTVRHYGADGVKDYTTPEGLDETGARLMFSMDGTDYREFWVRAGDTLAGLELEDGGGAIDMGGNNVPWMEITDHIRLYVVEAASGRELTAYTVAVVKDGEDGENGLDGKDGADGKDGKDGENGLDGKDGADGKDGGKTEFRFRITGSDETPARPEAVREPDGWTLTHRFPGAGERLWQTNAEIDGEGRLAGEWSEPVCMSGVDGKPGEQGEQGKPGPMVYPAGIFDRLTEYEATEKARPCVMDGRDSLGLGQYFVLSEGKRYCGATAPEGRRTPHEDYALGGGECSWERMDRFSMVFADIVMANFAKLASAVFSGDLMFSQQGVDDNGEYSENYESVTDGFNPNFMVDFLTGRLVARDGYFSGDIHANSLTLGMRPRDKAGNTMEGVLALDMDELTLPRLGKGEVREYRLLNALLTRTAPKDLTLLPEDGSIIIRMADLSIEAASGGKSMKIPEAGSNSGSYLTLLGIGYTEFTEWIAIDMSGALKKEN